MKSPLTQSLSPSDVAADVSPLTLSDGDDGADSRRLLRFRGAERNAI